MSEGPKRARGERLAESSATLRKAVELLSLTDSEVGLLEAALDKESSEWSAEESDVAVRVSFKTLQIERKEAYKASPVEERHKDHQRVLSIVGAYVGFVAAGCLAVVAASAQSPFYTVAVSLWVVSLPFLCAGLLIDHKIRVYQAREVSRSAGLCWGVGFLVSHFGTFALAAHFSWIAAVIYLFAPALLGLLINELDAHGGRGKFEDL